MLLLLCMSVFLQIFVVSGAYYHIPEPVITAFKPKGFEISIPHEEGVILFAFHANINRQMNYLEAGQISKDITKKVGNRWVFKDKNLHLRTGDILYYWLFVIKDGLGYRRDDGVFTVEELIPRQPNKGGNQNNNDNNGNRKKPIATPTTIPTPVECYTTPPTSTTEKIDMSHDLALCEESLTNVTQTWLNMKSKLDEVISVNAIMKDIIEKDPDGRRLKLSGRLPEFNDPKSAVRYVLDEKYSVNPNILTAYKHKDGSVSFEVSLEDKIALIKKQAELPLDVNSVQITY